MGEILAGIEYFNSGYPIKFLENVSKVQVCSKPFSVDDAAVMNHAIANHYWFQMAVDDLPIWGFIGQIAADSDVIEELEAHPDAPHEVAEGNLYLYTHFKFSFSYNENQIVEVALESDLLVKVQPGVEFPMYYSVSWTQSDVEFEKRFDKYLDYDFFEHQIHWFSIFNR